MPSSEDKWKKWLLEGRFAGDAEKKSLKHLGELAETLLLSRNSARPVG